MSSIFYAGQKVAAQDLDTVASTTTQIIGAIQTTATITLTGATVDLTADYTFTTTYPNTKIAIWASFDATVGSAGTGAVFVGTCLVDAVAQAGEAHLTGATGTRSTCFQQWLTTLAAAGNHVIKLQGTGNTHSTSSLHTKWHAVVFGP